MLNVFETQRELDILAGYRTRTDALEKQNAELLEALKNALARMDENPPKKEMKGDTDALWRNAKFYRDREDARRAIAKATE
jgi:hypothetical protein